MYVGWFGSDRRQCLGRLRARIQLVLICAVLICTPNYITLYFSGDFVPNHWLFATYSVLNFYVLALLAAPLWLRLIANSPVLRSVWLGAAHWVVGILLSHIWSANGDLGMADFIRQNLFAGPFAYLQAEGTALLALPVGLASNGPSGPGDTWSSV